MGKIKYIKILINYIWKINLNILDKIINVFYMKLVYLNQ